MIRVVLDTNILVSAMISRSGNEALILLAVRARMIQPCHSAEILLEYDEILKWPKFAFASDEVEELIDTIWLFGNSIVSPASPGGSPDPSDDKFIGCALAAAADYMVTGNKRHFPQAALSPTQVVNAVELLDRITLDL